MLSMVSRFLRASIVIAFSFCCAAASTATPLGGPPPTRVDNVVDDYYGHNIADPYRWLENGGDAEVKNWFKAQNDYTRSMLDRIPGRSALRDRIAQLSASGELVHTLQWAGSKLFYLKRGLGDKQFKLYERDNGAADEQLLVDPGRFDQDGQAAAINYYHPSPNGRYVAFGVSTGGSEKITLHVLDVANAVEVGTPIPRAVLDDNSEYLGFSWQMDSRSFFYNQLQELKADAPAGAYFQNSVARLRLLPADGANAVDMPVFSRATHPALGLNVDDVPMVYVSPVSPYAIGFVKHGDQNELTLYATPLTSLRGAETPWTLLADTPQAVTAFDLRGDYIYMLSNAAAPRSKLIRLSLSQALQTHAATTAELWSASETVLPPSERVLTGLAVAKDALYVSALDDGYGKLMRLQFNVKIVKAAKTKKGKKAKTHLIKSSLPKHAGVATQHDLPLPFAGALRSLTADPLQAGAWVKLESWNQPPRIFRVDGKSGKLQATNVIAASGADFGAVVVARAKVRSHDGVFVPLSIIYRKGLKLDGGNPTLLTGYGAYGLRLEPSFVPPLLAWLERGGVMAVANVRGGGEYGEEWHRAGQKLTKPNTWKDLIACGEWLIAKGYTDRAHLAGMGGSAGGITVGRALTERPNLFAAAVSNVGINDTLRAELTANGPPNISEFGTTKTEEGYNGLYAMSAYHHVRDGTRYPAVLLTTGINDPRVESWEPGKMAARLQAANGSGKPVLLRVEFAGGHGIGSTRDQVIEELADRYSFLLWQFGMAGFQPE